MNELVDNSVLDFALDMGCCNYSLGTVDLNLDHTDLAEYFQCVVRILDCFDNYSSWLASD